MTNDLIPTLLFEAETAKVSIGLLAGKTSTYKFRLHCGSEFRAYEVGSKTELQRWFYWIKEARREPVSMLEQLSINVVVDESDSVLSMPFVQTHNSTPSIVESVMNGVELQHNDSSSSPIDLYYSDVSSEKSNSILDNYVEDETSRSQTILPTIEHVRYKLSSIRDKLRQMCESSETTLRGLEKLDSTASRLGDMLHFSTSSK